MPLIHGVDCRPVFVENRVAFELQCRCHEAVIDGPFLRHDGDSPHLRVAGKKFDHRAYAPGRRPCHLIISHPASGAKRSPCLVRSSLMMRNSASLPRARMVLIGPPRCGAKPVPNMIPASQRSASATIFSRTHATASLTAGQG